MPLSHNDSCPDVSIVIPVFNKLELTQVCIASILEHGAQASFELIVVDNGSTDGTPDWLRQEVAKGHCKAILNHENQGFAHGCNAGAASANGQYILFLNNDMAVKSNWLDPMVTTLENDPEVGIVGAKLLFPDETIQHSGVTLVSKPHDPESELFGMHLNYKQPSHTPKANLPKYFQAVTGAALLIRRKLHLKLGGFNPQYWNGNEDVDLCLRVRAEGFKIVYRPESVIYHFESQSGPERWSHVKENTTLLNNTWKGRVKADCILNEAKEYKLTSDSQMQFYPERRLCRPDNTDKNGDTVSIIVLTWNALEYTQLCAASLLKHTDSRHEIIFVDNGSNADTVDYLLEMEKTHSQIKVILNGKNLGFAAGNNVGMAAARGQHVCLINSDTVVTAGWLENMISHLHTQPGAGLVGPLTNSITGPQKLDSVSYDQNTCEAMDSFAHTLTEKLKGQSQKLMWVVGFCVLIRGELLERLGGLDESFGQGNYEDTDYCLRAFVAGYDSIIAADSFVHHFGSRSFVEGKVDYSTLLDQTHEIFRRKWNLSVGHSQNMKINPEALASLGFIPALHFEPLPGLTTLALWDWEKDHWNKRGEAFFNEGRLDEAQRVFRRIVELSPGFDRAANNLACALWQTCDQEKAIPEAVQILEGILERDPKNEDALWNLKEIKPALMAH